MTATFVWALLTGRLKTFLAKHLRIIALVTALVALVGGAVWKHGQWVDSLREEVRTQTLQDVQHADETRAQTIRNRVDAVRPRAALRVLGPKTGDTRGYRD